MQHMCHVFANAFASYIRLAYYLWNVELDMQQQNTDYFAGNRDNYAANP